MNNEPVAWMLTDRVVSSVPMEGAIPLYTHPVKEQDTDCKYCKQGCIRCDARKQLTDEEILGCWVEEFTGNALPSIDFARAILKKALK